jgi:hypothetical protein
MFCKTISHILDPRWAFFIQVWHTSFGDMSNQRWLNCPLVVFLDAGS